MRPPCSVHDCVGESLVRGWCAAHYTRWKRYGDPTFSPGPSGVARTSLAERFWPKVDKRAPDECWPWIGHVKRNGYGAITLGGKSGKIEMAHRAAYMLARGPIVDGANIDHMCRNRVCVNPAHLQLVTRVENHQNRRGPNVTNRRSGHLNVHWNAKCAKWIVRVQVNGVTHRSGLIADLDEAVEVARELRMRVHTNNLADRA